MFIGINCTGNNCAAKPPALGTDLIRLLLRAGPFVLSRPDIAASPLPGGAAFGASHSFTAMGDRRPFLSLGIKVETLGGLVRMWDNMDMAECPECGGKSVIIDFGGSFLSGAGKFTEWFCPACGQTFTKIPKCIVAEIASALQKASRTAGLVIPSPETDTPVLPDGIKPRDLTPLFGGALLEAYAKCAISALRKLDAAAFAAASEGRTFQATFRIADGGKECDVVFGNVNGYAQLFRPGDCRPFAAVPIQWDDHFGLWPTLYAAADRLE